MLKNDQMAISG